MINNFEMSPILLIEGIKALCDSISKTQGLDNNIIFFTSFGLVQGKIVENDGLVDVDDKNESKLKKVISTIKEFDNYDDLHDKLEFKEFYILKDVTIINGNVTNRIPEMCLFLDSILGASLGTLSQPM